MSEQTTEIARLADHIRCVVPAMSTDLADRIAASLPDYIEDREDAARAEALTVAAISLRQIVDYWEGRPLNLHGAHIYADLLGVLDAIEADASYNEPRIPPGSPADTEATR